MFRVLGPSDHAPWSLNIRSSDCASYDEAVDDAIIRLPWEKAMAMSDDTVMRVFEFEARDATRKRVVATVSKDGLIHFDPQPWL